MFTDLIALLKKLFGLNSTVSDSEREKAEKAAQDYADATKTNITATFSNKLAAFVVTDSTLDIEGETARADIIRSVATDIWNQGKKIVARAFGTGGVLLVPSVVDGKLVFDVVDQNRLVIHSAVAGELKNASIVAEVLEINTKKYTRLINYQATPTGCEVRQKVITKGGVEVPLETVPAWADLTPEYTLAGTDKMPFAYLKSQVDNRTTRDAYGAQITYGCDKDMDELQAAYDQLAREFELKKAVIFVDERILDEKDQLVKSGLVKRIMGSDLNGSGGITEFSPQIREASFLARISELERRIEKSVGTSNGILTEVGTRGATATEIKSSMYDTYSIVMIMRSALDKAMRDFLAACDVLANAYGLSPAGQWEPKFDWSYQFVESSSETFAQLMQAEAVGAVSKSEVRQYIYNETAEEAEEAVRVIAENAPVQELDFGSFGSAQ